ncbi:hypothetical protein BG910_11065 [Neisseria chenwenguii]|uniref:Uncharacterized protein n=1 Tax=Neisseria chenwenguii TaxID=1853278 RepID=A0A220S4C8_9NEIS|nr:hypothetical protein [Neisseria chenwenguii]ASK28198.1 hypothetical protein BG910_11065 [Neisseria chenwenguii]
MLEQEILSVIRFYLDSTPPYYTISWYGAVFIFAICILKIIIDTIQRFKGIQTHSMPWLSWAVGMLAFIFIVHDDRPNLTVYYGHIVQEKLPSENIDYSQCTFGNEDYKVARQIGLEAYADAKSKAIMQAAQSGGDTGAKSCGVLPSTIF